MCCAVILNHLSIIFYLNLYLPATVGGDSSLGNSPLNLFWGWQFAVIVFFFAWSGYLLQEIQKEEKQNIFSDLFLSISKRYLRLMPCAAFRMVNSMGNYYHGVDYFFVGVLFDKIWKRIFCIFFQNALNKIFNNNFK